MAQQGPSPGDSDRTTSLATWVVLGAAVLLVIGLLSVRFELGPHVARPYASRTLPPEPEPRLRPPPPPDDEYYPCSDCHEDEPTDRTVRALEDEHDDLELAHGDLWCLSCHDVDDRDSLHLADGARIRFQESWRLCTQCHGEKLPDWRAGVHGKRQGHWWGEKEYWVCVSCHEPHEPRFRFLVPEPVPGRPAPLDARALARLRVRLEESRAVE